MKTDRNYSFDIVKFIASFAVICIHVSLFGGDFANAVDAVSRFAVPVFFAISGYFALNADTTAIKRRTLRILRLFLLGAALYHISDLIPYIVRSGYVGFCRYIYNTFFNIGNILTFVFANRPFTRGHLWFLLALIYVYLIWLLILKHRLNDRVLMIICVIGLAVHLMLGEIITAFGVVIDYIVIRNFAFMGMPFFIFGYFIAKYRERLKCIKTASLITAIILGSAEAVLSTLLIGRSMEMYIGTIAVCFSIMVLAEKHRATTPPRWALALIRTSTDVYVLHILALSLLGQAVALTPAAVRHVLTMIMPITVFITCIAASLLKDWLIKIIRKRKCS